MWMSLAPSILPEITKEKNWHAKSVQADPNFCDRTWADVVAVGVEPSGLKCACLDSSKWLLFDVRFL